METMHCNEFLELAGPWMEGERHPDAEAHLLSCVRCRAAVAELEAIRAAGLELGEEEVEPPARVWTALRTQLEKEGLIRDQVREGWFSGLLGSLPRPALAGAYLSMLLAAALLLTSQSAYEASQAQWLDGTQTTAASLGTELQTVEKGSVGAIAMHDHDPAVTASLSQNLVIVDNLIALCEKGVLEDPQNEMTRDYLYGAYQQKAELLATMTEREVNAQ